MFGKNIALKTGWISLLSVLVFLSVRCNKKLPTPTDSSSSGVSLNLAGYSVYPPAVEEGGGKATVQVKLVNDKAEPVVGTQVLFSTTLGTITPQAATDSSGLAQAIFRSGDQTGKAVVTVQFGQNQKKQLEIVVKKKLSPEFVLTVSQPKILSNGIDSSVVVCYLFDSGNRAAPNEPVTFQTSAGHFLHTQDKTDSTGRARAVLVGFASHTDSIAHISVTADQKKNGADILLKGILFSASARPSAIVADENSTAKIQVLVKEAATKIAIPNAEIYFGTDLGTIPNMSKTDASGVCSVELTSSSRTGLATVTARYGNLFVDTVRVAFVESTPAYMSVSANPSVIVADNQSQSTIKAVISDASNNPVPDGTPVAFRIIKGSGSVEKNKETKGGVATSLLTSGTKPDTALVLVEAGTLRDTVQVRYTVGDVAAIDVRADVNSIQADGVTSTNVRAYVYDAAGNPVPDGTTVYFSTSIGDISEKSLTQNGEAVAKFSSGVTGVAVIHAWVGDVNGQTTIQLLPGPPASIVLTFDPTSVGIKDSGRNQTTRIKAVVKDTKNNPAKDGTYVKFSIESSPDGGEQLSSTNPIPTVNGAAEVSFISGIRSGAVRIRADVTDAKGNTLSPPVRAISTELIIFAGPPYIENVNDPSTSHLSVGVTPVNVYGWHVVNNTVDVVAVVGDKYNNPVPEGTAVYFTTTGGVISTYTGYTNAEGVAKVTLHTGQPYPTITRFYNTFQNPNFGSSFFTGSDGVIPGPIPDFEGGQALNSLGNMGENDGVARILAVTEGMDSFGHRAKVWGVTSAVFSGKIAHFTVETSDTVLHIGQSAHIAIDIFDVNGNPIVPGSTILVEASAGALSWGSWTTSDPGITHYDLILTNNLDPTAQNAKPTATAVTIKVQSQNGNAMRSTPAIHLLLN